MTDDQEPPGNRGRPPSALSGAVTEVAATSALLIERARALVAENRRIMDRLDSAPHRHFRDRHVRDQ